MTTVTAALVSIFILLLVWDMSSAHTERRLLNERHASFYLAGLAEKINESCPDAEKKALISCVADVVLEVHESQRAEADLTAQQDMAQWALWMFLATGLSVVIGGGSLILIWRTVVYARQAANSGDAAVDEARKATAAANKQIDSAASFSQVELRAYMSFVELQFRIDRNPEMEGDFFISALAKLRNSGQTPAINGICRVEWIVAPPGNENIPVATFPSIPRVAVPVGPDVNFMSQYRRLPRELVNEASWKKVRLYFIGRCEYNDIWGGERYTEFCLRTHPEFKPANINSENVDTFVMSWNCVNLGPQNSGN